MPRDFSRTERVGQLLQTAVAKVVQDYLRDKSELFVTVTSTEVSRDFSIAKVFISVLPDDDIAVKKVLKLLTEQSKQFRYELAHTVTLRRMPALRFYFDSSIKTGSQINHLLQNIEG